MADDITVKTVINPREKMGVLEGLFQLAVSPALRARQQKAPHEIRLLADDNEDLGTVPLLEPDANASASMPSSHVHVSPIDKTPKPQIATETWGALIAGAYRKVFLGDGYDPSRNSVVTFIGSDANPAKGLEISTGGEEFAYQVMPTPEAIQVGLEAKPEQAPPLRGVDSAGVVHIGHAIASFFGVPNRFEKLGTDSKLVFNGWTILRNYTGLKRPLFETIKNEKKSYTFRLPGLNWGYIGGEYGFWQTLALPIKLGIGLPLKLALTVVQTAVNVVKLVTEFVPTLLVYGSAKVIRNLADTIAETRAQKTVVAISRSPAAKIGIYVGYSLLIGVLGLAHYVGRVALLLGTAFTSPSKLTKDAWDFAHQLVIKNSKGVVNTKATNVLNKTLGLLGSILAVSLTVALWAVALPFGIAALVKYVPQFMVAVNWVLATPFIAPALAYVNGALTVVGGYLSVFLPLINAVAVSAGLQVTAGVLAVGVSIGSIAAVVANIATPIINAIGNWAAKRPSNSGPFSYVMARRTAKGLPDAGAHDEPELGGKPDPAPRPEAFVAEDEENELVHPIDAAVRLLISQEKGREAFELAIGHNVHTKYFQPMASDPKKWEYKAVVPAPVDASVSDIARSLVQESRRSDLDATTALTTAEARVFAVLERDLAIARKEDNIVEELDQIIQDIDAPAFN